MSCRIRLAVSFVILFAGFASAQTLTGSIEGRVVGPEKAPIAGAMVRVTGPALQGAKQVRTNAVGDFHLPLLPPGAYQLEVRAEGFREVIQPGLVVSLDRVTHFDVVVEVATTAEVTVLGATPLIDTTWVNA